MADETRIEPDGARRLFTVVEGVAGDIEKALARVRTVRSTLSEPWGSDEYGERFAKPREPNAEVTLTNVGKAATYVRDFSAEGKNAVTAFQNRDTDNAGGLAPEK